MENVWLYHFYLAGKKQKIPIKECKANTGIEFRIRAINIDENKKHLEGDWSDPSPVLCGSSGWTDAQTTAAWAVGICSFLALTAVLSYVIKK